MANARPIIVSVLAVALAVVSVLPSVAQSASDRAVLVRGTLRVRGVEHFPANAVPAFYGEYRWDRSTVRVWVVREALYLSEDWTEYSFRSPSGRALKAFRKVPGPQDPGFEVLAVRSEEYWSVFEFPASEGDPRAFITSFSDRLRYFVAHSSPSDVSLPAVLEIR